MDVCNSETDFQSYIHPYTQCFPFYNICRLSVYFSFYSLTVNCKRIQSEFSRRIQWVYSILQMSDRVYIA